MAVDRNALLVVGWEVGEYSNMYGYGCGSGIPAGQRHGWRQSQGVEGEENTERITCAVADWDQKNGPGIVDQTDPPHLITHTFMIF